MGWLNNQPYRRRKKYEPVKKQIKKANIKLIEKIVIELKEELRSLPKEWDRAYYSAISKLERFKDEIDN